MTSKRLVSAVAVLAAPVGLWLVFLSWGPLHRLFAGDRENILAVYIVLGAVYLVPGLALLRFSAMTLFQRGQRVSQAARGR